MIIATLLKSIFVSLVKKATIGAIAKAITVYEIGTTVYDIIEASNTIDTINDCQQLNIFGEHVVSTITDKAVGSFMEIDKTKWFVEKTASGLFVVSPLIKTFKLEGIDNIILPKREIILPKRNLKL